MGDMPSETQFDIALSYAGPDRAYATELAEQLKARGYRVYFDLFERGAILGRELRGYLKAVFASESEYVVTLLSVSYASRDWPLFELQSARSGRAMDRILPIRLDAAAEPWPFPTTAFLNAAELSIEEIREVIVDKLIRAGIPSNRMELQLGVWHVRDHYLNSHRLSLGGRYGDRYRYYHYIEHLYVLEDGLIVCVGHHGPEGNDRCASVMLLDPAKLEVRTFDHDAPEEHDGGPASPEDVLASICAQTGISSRLLRCRRFPFPQLAFGVQNGLLAGLRKDHDAPSGFGIELRPSEEGSNDVRLTLPEGIAHTIHYSRSGIERLESVTLGAGARFAVFTYVGHHHPGDDCYRAHRDCGICIWKIGKGL